MRVALIGCGAIGKVIAKAIWTGEIPGIQLVALAELCASAEVKEISEIKGIPIVEEPEALLAYNPTLVIEAAGQHVARQFVPFFLKASKDVMIMSVGALADARLFQEIQDLARSHGVRVILPSGAIGGLDAIKAANIGQLTEVTIRTTKPPKALEGAPYIERNGIDLSSLTSPTVIYEGFADEAAREFPKNTNVTVALSLAGIGPQKTKVVVMADPAAKRNIHEITAKGDFGEATFTLCCLPSPENPKTSYLASLSAIATLKNLASPLHLGT